jgi:hypothetical protein
MWKKSLVVITAWVLVGAAAPGRAAVFTLADNNSSIDVDPESQDGLFNWSIDGIDQMSREWFWFRIEGDTQESSLDTLNLTSTQASGNELLLSYAGTAFTADIKYTLSGDAAGSGFSSIDEKISLTNTGSNPLLLTWFGFTDLDLNGTPDDEQTSGGVNGITQVEGGLFAFVSSSLLPNAFQIAEFDELRDLLNDGSITNLDNSGSPLGLADSEFAFQWNLNIPGGSSVEFDQTKAVAPEPGTLGLLGTGIALLLAGRWRKKRAAC